MKNIYKFIISFGSIIISFIVISFLLSIFYYYDLISTNTYQVFKISLVVLTLILSGILLGRKSNKNGMKNGLVLGLMCIVLSLIVGFSTKSISLHFLIYHFILLICTGLGGTIGIQTKKKKS